MILPKQQPPPPPPPRIIKQNISGGFSDANYSKTLLASIRKEYQCAKKSQNNYIRHRMALPLIYKGFIGTVEKLCNRENNLKL